MVVIVARTTAIAILTMIAVTAAVGLGIARVGGVRLPGFQAVAHLYVGALFVGGATGGGRWLLWLAAGLTLVEGLCFVFLVN